MDAKIGSVASVSSPASSYQVVARVTRRGVAMGLCKGSEILFDSSRGQDDQLPGPAELLALSLGACILKNVERFSKLLSFAYDGAAVSIEAERQDDPPRFTKLRYELRIRTDEDPGRIDLLHRNLRRFGTVYNTLAATCDVDGSILAGPDVTPAFEQPAVDPLLSHTCC
jgi:uncharacterized OsmC-like protein